jgi:hypothetical protein
MCYYEKIYFVPCGHEGHRLIQHCHFARNDPLHQCFGAWNVKRAWVQHETECDACTDQRLKSNEMTGGNWQPNVLSTSNNR